MTFFATIIVLWSGARAALLCQTLPAGDIADGVVWGSALALANALAAFIAFRVALWQADNAMFLRIVFGSMITRLVLSLGAVWYALRVGGFDAVAFIVSLLGFYTVAMALELIAIHRRQLSLSRARYAQTEHRAQAK